MEPTTRRGAAARGRKPPPPFPRRPPLQLHCRGAGSRSIPVCIANLRRWTPRNEAFDRNLDPEFKRFLLEPGNLKSLQTLILHHVVPTRVASAAWPRSRRRHRTLALAPAPGPGPGHGKHWFDGQGQVKDFIHTLLLYGGYNELADILVNLTSLATEMGRLVSEGYVLTVLAPNDDAMAKLTTDQLSEPGAPEAIMYYHLIPEYQTEESMYNAVRRFGKVRYDTLRVPHKVVAREADGSVRFGAGEGSAYLIKKVHAASKSSSEKMI